MTSSVGGNHSDSELCPPEDNSTVAPTDEGEFYWSSELQGIVLGSFYYGYLLTQIPGGRLSERFGARRVIGYELAVNSILALLTPVLTRVSVYALIALRVGQGMAAGMVLPSSAVVLEEWGPVPERSRMNAVILSGSHIGIVISQLLAGVLSDSAILGGWPSVFYFMGVCGLVSAMFWLLIASESPAQCRLISPEEKEYIEKNLTSKPRMQSTPWKDMFKSLPVWAIIISMTMSVWALFTLTSMLPTYIEHVLHTDTSKNGVLSSLPFLVTCIVTNVCGVLSDFLLHRKVMSTSAVRKLMTFLGGMSLAGFTMAAGFTGCDVTLSLVFLTLGVGLSGFLFGGMFVNPIDIAEHYAGTLIGIINACGTLPGFIAPHVAGYILGDEPTLERWRTVFLLAGGICAVGTMFFVLFSAGEVQPWAVGEQKEKSQTPEPLSNQTQTGHLNKTEDNDGIIITHM